MPIDQETGRFVSTDHAGKRFGKLVAIRKVPIPPGQKPADQFTYSWWLLQCDCGQTATMPSYRFVRGHAFSCGCERKPVGRPRIPNGGSHVNAAYSNCRRAAYVRSIAFKLSRDEYRAIIELPCYYCGLEPTLKAHRNLHGEFARNGVDRIDSGKSYVASNCVACCKWCNIAKASMSQSEFYAWAQRLVANLKASDLI